MTILAIALALLPPAQDTLPYRFTVVNRQSIESATIGQGSQHNLLRMDGTFIVIVRDTVGGSSVAVHFDSVRMHSSNPVMSGMLPRVLTGTKYHFVIAGGKPTTAPMPDSITIGSVQVMPVVNALFPAIPLNATLGDCWSDTTVTDSLVAGKRMTGIRLTDWRVVDRRADTLSLDAKSSGSAAADIGDEGRIEMTTWGTSRLTILPGLPAYTITNSSNSTVSFWMGQLSTKISQQLKLSLSRRDLHTPGPRKEVPL